MARETSVRCLVLVAAAVALTGCVNRLAFFDTDRSIEGALPIIEDNRKFFKVDLVNALDPHRYGSKERRIAWNMEPKVPSGNGSETGWELSDELEDAFTGFIDTRYDEGIYDVKARRNRLQDRLVASSNQACAEFKRHINALQSETNFILGTITTALAGAGAIVTGASGARALAGTAGIFSGVRAEFNENLFRKLTVEVITKAIESRRKQMRERMEIAQKNESATVYTAEGAVGDAIVYNDVCSLIGGLEVASIAVTVAEDPGLKRLSELYGEDFNATVTLNAGGAGAAAGTVELLDGTTLDRPSVSPSVSLANAKQGVRLSADKLNNEIEQLIKEDEKKEHDSQLVKFKSALEAARKTANEQFDRINEGDKAKALERSLADAFSDVVAATDSVQRSDRQAELIVRTSEARAFISRVLARKAAFDSKLKEVRVGLEKIKEKLDKAAA